MITTLRLQHFVLIEESVILFEKGLNILTGETGAGKTILIQAINLLMGQKADSTIIRSGQDQAVIEASFEIDQLASVQTLLNEAGITFDKSEELIIKREISRNSKNRIFINAQLAPLQLLTQLGTYLFEIAGQNTSMALRSVDEQRHILDTYGNINTVPFSASYKKEKALKSELSQLKHEKLDAERKTDRIRWELEDLQSIDLSEDENDLFATYQKQVSSQELTENLSLITQGLETSILPTLTQYNKLLDSNELLETALSSLNELSFTLSTELENLSQAPQQLELLEQKLSALNTIKKKHHLETHEIPKRIQQLEKELEHFEKLDSKIEAMEKEAQTVQSKCRKLSFELTQQRTQAAQSLEQVLTAEIRLLNMPDAQFHVQIGEKEIGPEGSDLISFSLAANCGEKPAPVKSKTSGGELSRLFFALKLLLAEKEAIPILIFDEIDSNIGGETATLIGEKLLELSQSRQVLCITHFAQVARFAMHHLLIAKRSESSRTITTIQSLDDKQRQTELLRMMGGKAALAT